MTDIIKIENLIFKYPPNENGEEKIAINDISLSIAEKSFSEPLDWAFFAVDQCRFLPTAIFSAMVQALRTSEASPPEPRRWGRR